MAAALVSRAKKLESGGVMPTRYITEDPATHKILNTICRYGGDIVRKNGRGCIVGVPKGALDPRDLRAAKKGLERILTSLEACRRVEDMVAGAFPGAIVESRTVY